MAIYELSIEEGGAFEEGLAFALQAVLAFSLPAAVGQDFVAMQRPQLVVGVRKRRKQR